MVSNTSLRSIKVIDVFAFVHIKVPVISEFYHKTEIQIGLSRSELF